MDFNSDISYRRDELCLKTTNMTYDELKINVEYLKGRAKAGRNTEQMNNLAAKVRNFLAAVDNELKENLAPGIIEGLRLAQKELDAKLNDLEGGRGRTVSKERPPITSTMASIGPDTLKISSETSRPNAEATSIQTQPPTTPSATASASKCNKSVKDTLTQIKDTTQNILSSRDQLKQQSYTEQLVT